jgi:hypothetical protein
MNNPRFSHLKRYVIACCALSLVVAGTAYASVKVAQRETAGVTCEGSCPAKTVYWAYACAYCGQNSLFGASAMVTQTASGGVPAQLYHVQTGDWIVRFDGADLSNCAKFANLTSIRGSATVLQYGASSAGSSLNPNPDPTAVEVLTTDANGHAFDADFVVGVLCGGGAGAQLAAH